jgi:thioredoxin-related protein
MKTNFLRLVLLAVILLPCAFTRAFSQEAQWLTDYSKAVQQAKTENKVILLDFTGSDWCGWCMKMKKETLDTPTFKHYAGKNLVLVELDFPQHKQQTDEIKRQNGKLSQQFKIAGYPAFVLLDKDGKELGRQGGYLKGGPGAFIAKLNTFYKPSSASPGAGGGASAGGSDDFDKFFKKPAQSPTP